MKTDKLSQYLELLVREYADRTEAENFRAADDSAEALFSVEYEELKYEFVYSKKARNSYPVSTLFCRVYLDKENPFFFEIPEIIAYLELLDFHAYHFAYIESNKRMKACFDYITDFLDYRKEEIESLTYDFDELYKEKKEEIIRVYGIDASTEPENEDEKDEYFAGLDSYASSFTAGRFTTGKAFSAYVKGDYEKALEEYEKQGELLTCEKRIVEFIDGKLEPYQVMPEECASVIDVEKYKSHSFKLFIITLIASTVFGFVLFLIIQLIVNAVAVHTTVICNTVSPFKTAFFGIFTGVFGTLAFRDKLEPLFMKGKKEAIEFNDLLSNQKFFTPIRIVFIVVFAISIIGFIDFSRPPFLMYEDKVMYNSHAHTFNHYSVYPLEDLEDVICVDGHFEDNYNKYVENPFYVITFRGGRYIAMERLSKNSEKQEEIIKKIRRNRESDIPHVRSIEEL